MNNKIVYEAFCASFTGQMSTCRINNGKVYTFKHPLPRVKKDRMYVIAFNPTNGSCRLLMVRTPEEVLNAEPVS